MLIWRVVIPGLGQASWQRSLQQARQEIRQDRHWSCAENRCGATDFFDQTYIKKMANTRFASQSPRNPRLRLDLYGGQVCAGLICFYLGVLLLILKMAYIALEFFVRERK